MTVLERPASRGLRPGSRELRRLHAAMIAAGVAAFAMLYSTQASLPAIGATFGVGATAASLTVSVTTGALALTVLPASGLAERLGRVRAMGLGLGVAAVTVALAAAAPNLPVLLLVRGVTGLALAAVVAVAMGHIGDEVEPSASASAVGLYVSATTIGGLAGRLIPAGVDAHGGWWVALLAVAALGALCTAVFVRTVPAARAEPRATGGVGTVLRDPTLVRICLVGLLLMGGFVGTYNYLTFRLGRAPFDLSAGKVGTVFLAYLAGTASSAVAGRCVARVGRGTVLLVSITVALGGLALTLPTDLGCVLAGLLVFTAGFFGAHAVASGWAAARVPGHRGQASALYLTAYYLGSSLGGTLVGLAWTDGGWPATVAAVAGAYLVAGALMTRRR